MTEIYLTDSSDDNCGDCMADTDFVLFLDELQGRVDFAATETRVLDRPSEATQSSLFANIVIRPKLPPTTTQANIVIRPKMRLRVQEKAKPKLTETQKDVAYGAAVGALVGSASVLLFALLVLLSS